MGAKKLFRQKEREMTKEEIRRKCSEVVVQQLDVDVRFVLPESKFIDDLGADSLAIVELVLAAEEAFEIDIPDEDTEKIRTFGEAVAYIEYKLSPPRTTL